MEIRVAAIDDLPALAATLADAFLDDPVWSWMLPERNRYIRLRRILGALLEPALPTGQVRTTAERDAVAVWSAPGQWQLPLPAVLRVAPPLIRGAGLRLPRVLRRTGEVERAHQQQPPEHWSLEFLGTAAAVRGRGIGAALLEEGLERLAGTPVYLESSNARNLSFYQRHGFEVTGNVPVRSGPPQWTLWRG